MLLSFKQTIIRLSLLVAGGLLSQFLLANTGTNSSFNPTINTLTTNTLTTNTPTTNVPISNILNLDTSITDTQASLPQSSETASSEFNSDAFEKQRAMFIEAENALKKGKIRDFTKLENELKDYPLFNYLKREHLLNNLSLANKALISEFLNQNTGKPVTRKLRYKWLFWLAENNHASTFLRHYQHSSSISLRCYQLYFRLRTHENRNDLASEVEKVWLSPQSLPKSCDKLFAAWQKKSPISQPLIWQRLLLAAKSNNKSLTSYLKTKMSQQNRPAAELLVKSLKKPESLKKIDFKLPLTEKAKEIIDLSLSKMAWDKPEETIKLWKHLEQKFGYSPSSHRLKRSIALSLAIDKSPLALDWLNSLSHLKDDSINQWILSTSIEQGDWQAVASHTNSLSEETNTNKWVYWQAVAETQLGNLEKAEALFTKIASSRSYYGFLAARQINKQPELAFQPVDFELEELDLLNSSAAAKRAYEFYRMDRLPEARREWNHLVRATPTKDQIKLAAIAHQWGWQHQAILAFARSKQINDVEKRFPLQHYEIYKENANKHQIPTSWAFAITRQESAFKTDARSSANARGLMQLRPGTARMVSKFDKDYKKPSQLYSASTNIRLGTAYLGQMYQSFDKHPVLATAAYNAGKTKVKKWLERSSLEDPVHWIEQIPYKETREYVKNVLTYQLIYARLTNQNDDFIRQLADRPITYASKGSSKRVSK